MLDIVKFTYEKDGVKTTRELLDLGKDSSNYMEGIDLSKLDQSERVELTEAFTKLSSTIKKMMKGWRKFEKSKITV